MQNVHLYSWLRVIVPAILSTVASAQLSDTPSTIASGHCVNSQGPVWDEYEYSNWQYKDASGVSHDFLGDTLYEARTPYTCGDGGHTCYCGTSVSTSLKTLSMDNAYYLQATGYSGTAAATSTGVYYPAYHLVSILYSPPGNKGQNGYTNSVSDGAVTTVGSTFSYGESITFTEGFGDCDIGCVSASEGFGGSVTTSGSSAFQETFTDTTGVTLNNQTTNPDAVNHDLDYFLIWLNPQVSAVGVPPYVYGYSVGVEPTANGDTPLPDIIGQNAITMEANAAGVTTIQPTWLNPQTDPATGQSVPGLAIICKNLNLTEYNAKQCTLADQCGCAPSDFAPILKMDPLLYSNGTSSPISPYPGYANPLAADVSGETSCSTIPTPAGSNCRYIPVPDEPGSTTQETLTLAGPDCSWCGTTSWPFMQADNQTKTNTQGFMTEEDVSYSEKYGTFGFSVTETDTWKWTQSQSSGLISGNGYTAAVTLSSTTTGCGQTIPVFEDTVYHTFLFMQPGSSDPSQAASCTTTTATPTFSPAAGTYASSQTVTISTSSTGASIYYTTNGTTPTTSSTLYAGPITVSTTETVKAISAIPGWTASAAGSAVYTIE